MPNSGRREVTAPIEVRLVGDRIHFDVISDDARFPFSVSIHKARNAQMCAGILLDEAAGKQQSNVMPFGKR